MPPPPPTRAPGHLILRPRSEPPDERPRQRNPRSSRAAFPCGYPSARGSVPARALLVPPQRPLRRQPRSERQRRRHPLRVDLDTAMSRKRLAQHKPVFRQGLRVPLRAEFVQQPCRTLHIREQQRHRSPWQVAHRPRIARRRHNAKRCGGAIAADYHSDRVRAPEQEAGPLPC